MIQEIVVYVIGIAVAAFIISKVYKVVFGKKQNANTMCAGCSIKNNYNQQNRLRV